MGIMIESENQYSNIYAMTKINLKYLFILNFVFIALITTFNLLGLSSLKYFFILYSLFVLVTISFYPMNEILFVVISLLFFEGQGRVLLEYNPIVRILFDSILGLAIIRQLIHRKKLINTTHIPTFFTALFILHILWYIFEIFNIYNVGYTAPISASKFYIFPFLLFYTFLNMDLDIRDIHFKRFTLTVLVLIIAEVAISINQLVYRETLMRAISGYYNTTMKNVFVGAMFRPFGTTHVPGGVCGYLVWSMALLFLPLKPSKILTFFTWLAVIVGVFIIFTTQVRSALIKYGMIIISTFIIMFIVSKKRLRFLFVSAATLVVLVTVIVSTGIFDKLVYSLNLASSVERISTLKRSKLAKANHRINFNDFLQVAEEKLTTYPLGFGPGLPTLGKDLMGSDPVLTADNVWSYDNLIIFLIIDFGYGFIFYLLYIVGIPFYLGLKTLASYKEKNYDAFKIRATALSVLITSLIGNWGAVGIPFNPESFFFWLWAAIGITAYSAKRSEPLSAT